MCLRLLLRNSGTRGRTQKNGTPNFDRPAPAVLRAVDNIPSKTAEAVETGLTTSSSVADGLALGPISAITKLALGDYKGAALSAAFMAIPGGKMGSVAE